MTKSASQSSPQRAGTSRNGTITLRSQSNPKELLLVDANHITLGTYGNLAQEPYPAETPSPVHQTGQTVMAVPAATLSSARKRITHRIPARHQVIEQLAQAAAQIPRSAAPAAEPEPIPAAPTGPSRWVTAGKVLKSIVVASLPLLRAVGRECKAAPYLPVLALAVALLFNPFSAAAITLCISCLRHQNTIMRTFPAEAEGYGLLEACGKEVSHRAKSTFGNLKQKTQRRATPQQSVNET